MSFDFTFCANDCADGAAFCGRDGSDATAVGAGGIVNPPSPVSMALAAAATG